MKILEILQDKAGKLSSLRLFMLLVSMSAIIDWQHAVWTVGVWNPSYNILIFILAVLGIKLRQNLNEKKTIN